jgi:hypothetical protein
MTRCGLKALADLIWSLSNNSKLWDVLNNFFMIEAWPIIISSSSFWRNLLHNRINIYLPCCTKDNFQAWWWSNVNLLSKIKPKSLNRAWIDARLVKESVNCTPGKCARPVTIKVIVLKSAQSAVMQERDRTTRKECVANVIWRAIIWSGRVKCLIWTKFLKSSSLAKEKV